MADAVQSKVIYEGAGIYIIKLTCLSDGTGETDVTKVDISTLNLGPNSGNTVTKTAVIGLFWNIGGFTNVELYWNHTTDVTIAQMSGSSFLDFSGMGDDGDTGTGEDGDIKLTSRGAVANASYTIILALRKIAA